MKMKKKALIVIIIGVMLVAGGTYLFCKNKTSNDVKKKNLY